MTEQTTAGTVPEQSLTPRQQIAADLEHVRRQRDQFAQQFAQAQAGLEQCNGAIAAYERTLSLLPADETIQET